MEYSAKIIGYTHMGPRIEVSDETGAVIKPSEQPREWLGTVASSGLLDADEARQRVGLMFQRGRDLDEMYGPRLENDRA